MRLTKKRTLHASGHADCAFTSRWDRVGFRMRFSVTVGPRGCPDCAFPSRRDHRVRLYVSVRGQNALLRKLRFFSPGQTWRRLTEKRILLVAPHGKAHSVRRISRKSAFCVWPLTERRILGGRGHGKAHSGGTPSRKSALCTSDLTEKRTLHASGHADCAFPSRWDRVGFRMRFSVTTRPQNAPLRECPGPECAFP